MEFKTPLQVTWLKARVGKEEYGAHRAVMPWGMVLHEIVP
jgi:hypothetical protein